MLFVVVVVSWLAHSVSKHKGPLISSIYNLLTPPPPPLLLPSSLPSDRPARPRN